MRIPQKKKKQELYTNCQKKSVLESGQKNIGPVRLYIWKMHPNYHFFWFYI